MVSAAFHRFLCGLNQHRPQRSHVTWDGINYVGRCEHCDLLIRRKARRQWRHDTERAAATGEAPGSP
jgi:hypothetical protein